MVDRLSRCSAKRAFSPGCGWTAGASLVWPPIPGVLCDDAMFDLWGKIANGGGRTFVEQHVNEFSPLEWVEIGDMFPDLIPAHCREYDWRKDNRVVKECPFVRLRRCGNPKWREDTYSFRVRGALGDKDLLAAAYIDGALATLEYTDACYDYGAEYKPKDPACEYPAFGCNCGSALCDGFCYERCHVSRHLVHWTVIRSQDKLDIVYDRTAYDLGVLRMLRGLLALAHSNSPRRRRACKLYEIDRYERLLCDLVERQGARFDNFIEFCSDDPWHCPGGGPGAIPRMPPWTAGTIGTRAVGFNYHSVVRDKADVISLRREPENPHDKYAIVVWNETKNAAMGYLPRYKAYYLAPLIDEGRISLTVRALGKPDRDGRALIRIEVTAHDDLRAECSFKDEQVRLHEEALAAFRSAETPKEALAEAAILSGKIARLNAPAMTRVIYWILWGRQDSDLEFGEEFEFE